MGEYMGKAHGSVKGSNASEAPAAERVFGVVCRDRKSFRHQGHYLIHNAMHIVVHATSRPSLTAHPPKQTAIAVIADNARNT